MDNDNTIISYFRICKIRPFRQQYSGTVELCRNKCVPLVSVNIQIPTNREDYIHICSFTVYNLLITKQRCSEVLCQKEQRTLNLSASECDVKQDSGMNWFHIHNMKVKIRIFTVGKCALVQKDGDLYNTHRFM